MTSTRTIADALCAISDWRIFVLDVYLYIYMNGVYSYKFIEIFNISYVYDAWTFTNLAEAIAVSSEIDQASDVM